MANKELKKRKRAAKRKAKAAERKTTLNSSSIGSILAISESGAKKLLSMASTSANSSTPATNINSASKSGMMVLESATGMLVPTTNYSEESIIIDPHNTDSSNGEVGQADESQNVETRKVINFDYTGIFRIPVHGVIVSNDYGEYPFGGYFVTPEAILWAINIANSSPYVTHIVLDINSPGGDLFLGQEVVEAIRNSKKPVYTYISGMACSQAFLYASATQSITSARDGIAGSLGVMTSYMTPEEFEGFAVSGFAQKKNSQESAISIGNELEELYHRTIADGRGVTLRDVRTNYGNGEEIIASRAQSLGMIDDIKSRQSFYLDLYNSINFDSEKVEEELEVGDVMLSPNQTFEMEALTVVEEEVVVSNPQAQNKESTVTNIMNKNYTSGSYLGARAGKNTKNINFSDKKGEKNKENLTKNETKLKTDAQTKGNTNTPLNKSEDESKETKQMPTDTNASAEGVNNEKETEEKSEAVVMGGVSNDTVVAAAAAAAATYNKMSKDDKATPVVEDPKAESTTASADMPEDAVVLSMSEMEEMLKRAHSSGVEAQKKLAAAEKKAEEDRKAAVAARLNAIVESDAGKQNPELAQALAVNADLADKDATIIVGILEGMVGKSVPAQASSSNTSDVQEEVAAIAAPVESGNSPAEKALNERLAALEAKFLQDAQQGSPFAGTNVVSPMVAALDNPTASTDAVDPMADKSLVDDKNAGEVNADALENSPLYRALKATGGKDFDEKSARAMVEKSRYEESVYGPSAQLKVSDDFLARIGISSVSSRA